MSLFIPSFGGLFANQNAAAWTPMSLTGIYAWFDSQDISKITKDGSNNVTAWADSSGHSSSLTASGTAGPTYSATELNSKPGLIFSASKGLVMDTYLKDFPKAQNALTVIMILLHITRDNLKDMYYWANGVSTDYTRLELLDYASNGRLRLQLRQLDADGRYDDNTSASYPLPQTVLVHRLSCDYAAKHPYQYISSVGDTTDIENSTTLSNANAVSNTTSTEGDLGGAGVCAGSGAAFALGEFILCRSVLGSTDITNVNTYLKTRWGIT